MKFSYDMFYITNSVFHTAPQESFSVKFNILLIKNTWDHRKNVVCSTEIDILRIKALNLFYPPEVTTDRSLCFII